ncbi:Maturase K [Gossypium arboreum]|uniref:Maturase K n=1 Tax=Gossypium arboreum TaxID=29729 RepID=A0A0B0NP02_GOSAR|nr:Maturase K [Gossypium arboreum]
MKESVISTVSDIQSQNPTQPASTHHLRLILHSMWGYNQPTNPCTPKSTECGTK